MFKYIQLFNILILNILINIIVVYYAVNEKYSLNNCKDR